MKYDRITAYVVTATVMVMQIEYDNKGCPKNDVVRWRQPNLNSNCQLVYVKKIRLRFLSSDDNNAPTLEL